MLLTSSHLQCSLSAKVEGGRADAVRSNVLTRSCVRCPSMAMKCVRTYVRKYVLALTAWPNGVAVRSCAYVASAFRFGLSFSQMGCPMRCFAVSVYVHCSLEELVSKPTF